MNGPGAKRKYVYGKRLCFLEGHCNKRRIYIEERLLIERDL